MLFASASMAVGEPASLTLDFNTDWGFRLGDVAGADKADYNDTGWAAVCVPHTIRLERKHCGGDIYQGFAWYRRHFTADPAWKGKRVNIDFEGVQTECWVYLNGVQVANHAGGYMGFSVDISDKLRFDGPNVLSIRVSNLDNPDIPPGKPYRHLDFNYFGGLYRNVHLRVQDPLRITDPLQADQVAGGGVFVTYPKVSAAEAVVHVKTHVLNQRPQDVAAVVRSALVDPAGTVVAQSDTPSVALGAGNDQHVEQDLTVTKPKLWHPDHPSLYRLVSEVRVGNQVVDSQETRIGIRRIEFKPEGFFINGEKLLLRGGNRHQQLPTICDALPDSLQRRDAELLRASGFNSVRAAHLTNAPAFFDACDELGLLVITAQPGWQNFTKTQLFRDRTMRDAQEMIRRDRNHPCVMLYETWLNETAHPGDWIRAVTALAKAEYPGDQLFQACDDSRPEYNVGFKVITKKPMSDFKDSNPAKPFVTREWGDTYMTRQLRSAGEMGLITQAVTYQRYLDGDGDYSWGGMDACERIGGYFIWSWMDHTRGVRQDTAACGTVDSNRYPKFSHYYFRSMVDAHNPAWGPMAFLADYNMPADRSKEQIIKHGGSDRIVGWTLPWTSNTVLAFSNCDSLRLYQNGTLIGEKTRAENAATAPFIAKRGGSPYFIFTLPDRRPGVLRVEGTLDGKVAATHEVRTPDKAAAVAIEPAFRTTPLVADGSDLFPVYIRIVDGNGTLVPTATNAVTLKVEGEGRLVGAGIPRIGVENQRCEAGIGQAYIRSSGKPGRIVIKATAPGLAEGRMEITSVPSTHQFVKDAPHGAWSLDPSLLEAASMVTDAPVGPVGTAITDAQIESIRATSEKPGQGVAAMRDGIEEFGTGWLAGTATLPQSVTVTLKNPMPISAIQTLWDKDSTWYTYSVEGSPDGKTWSTLIPVKSVTGHERLPERFAPATPAMKVIRIVITDVQTGTSDMALGIAELRLFTP